MTKDSVHLIEISGDAGLRVAQDTAVILREALASFDNIAIATEAITGADITTIQLLLAARKQALASAKSLTLAAPPTGVLRALLIETGCLDAAGRPLTQDGDFWIQPTRQSVPA
ncbi:STAS domain-containing protein [Devosia sp. A449]